MTLLPDPTTSRPAATGSGPRSRGAFDRHAGRERHADVVRVAISTVLLWADRGRSRRALAELDDHHLRDIGLSRVEARRESAKPFWVP